MRDDRGFRRRLLHAGSDRWLALAVFLALGAIYVYTLLPGLGGTEDTPKFQYRGAALGTPHDPGYPLYMIACWAASKLPVGILAYRINLLSAFWGATAGALAFLAMRRLAVPRGIAVCTALALGLGRCFWQHSTFAEAYTQVSAFTAAAFLALLVWDQDGRERWLYAAIAATSLAFGTHLIVVGMIPAFAWFVLSRYRWRMPLRVLAVISVIVALGVAQYGYVWIRTAQHARYLEARASSVGDLVATLRGRQFEGQTFKEPPLFVAQKRIPDVAATALADLGALAGVAALAGVLVTWRTRRRQAVLLTVGCLGPELLLACLGDVATIGIQLPALMPVWMLAGCGFAGAWRGAAALNGRTPRVAAQAAIALAVAIMPGRQMWQNFEFNNSRHDTYYTDYFRALVDILEGPTVFLREEYSIAHMLEYTRYTTHVADMLTEVDRNPVAIAQFLREGAKVYAFRYAFDALDGYIRVRPVTLTGRPLDERLRWMRDGKIVVMAGFAPVWPDVPSLALGSSVRVAGRAVVIAVKGVGPAVVTGADFQGVVEVRQGEPLGKTGHVAPVGIRVEVQGTRATIAVDGLPVVQADPGLAVAEIGTGLEAAYALRLETAFRTPIDMGLLRLYRILEMSPPDSCTALAPGGWTPLADPGREGRLVFRVGGKGAFETGWVVYFAGENPLPARVAEWPWAVEPVVSVESFETRGDAGALRRVLNDDGFNDIAGILRFPSVTRLAVTGPAGFPGVLRVNLGALPVRAWARTVIDQAPARPASLCAGAVQPLEPDTYTQQAQVYFGSGGDWFFGSNWHNPEPVPAGFVRRTGVREATLLLPVKQAAAVTIRVSAEPLDGAEAVALSLNGHALPRFPLRAGWNELAWPVAADAWRAGVNELSIHVSGAPATERTARPGPSLRLRSLLLDWSGTK